MRVDAETGTYYARARNYNPALGRFLQSDPIGPDGGINLYAYAGNDPLNRVDPMGTEDMLFSGYDQFDSMRSLSNAPSAVSDFILQNNLLNQDLVSQNNFETYLLGWSLAGQMALGFADLAAVTAVEDMTANTMVSLYRAVGKDEAASIINKTAYTSAPSGGGKYFAFNLSGQESATNFASLSFNDGIRPMTMTGIDVTEDFLANGTRFYDPGGAGSSIHFADEFLEALNKFGLPKILGQ